MRGSGGHLTRVSVGMQEWRVMMECLGEMA